jgi:hypothetical protein
VRLRTTAGGPDAARTVVPASVRASVAAAAPAPDRAEREAAATRRGRAARVVLRRPVERADWAAAAGAGALAAVAAGLATFYLTAIWRARDPR